LSLFVVFVSVLIVLMFSSGCGNPNLPVSNSAQPTPLSNSNTTTTVPVLLFNGTGTSASDVTAVQSVLSTLNLKYSTANTAQIEAMSESQLAAYKLMIVPGGNSIKIGNSLSKAATTNIHNAVTNN